MGAWDYVTKPFSPTELLARVRGALRRSAQVEVEDIFALDDVTVSFSKMLGTVLKCTGSEESLSSFCRSLSKGVSTVRVRE